VDGISELVKGKDYQTLCKEVLESDTN
jgi:hypothetical protein